MIDSLNDKHHLAALLAACGRYNQNEICELAGFSPTHYSVNIKPAPAFRAEVALLRTQLRARTADLAATLAQKADDYAEDALTTLHDIMTDGTLSEAARVSAAKDLLDRAPSAPQKRALGAGESSNEIRILLPARARDNIAAALTDVGERDTLDLLASGDGSYAVSSPQSPPLPPAKDDDSPLTPTVID